MKFSSLVILTFSLNAYNCFTSAYWQGVDTNATKKNYRIIETTKKLITLPYESLAQINIAEQSINEKGLEDLWKLIRKLQTIQAASHFVIARSIEIISTNNHQPVRFIEKDLIETLIKGVDLIMGNKNSFGHDLMKSIFVDQLFQNVELINFLNVALNINAQIEGFLINMESFLIDFTEGQYAAITEYISVSLINLKELLDNPTKSSNHAELILTLYMFRGTLFRFSKYSRFQPEALYFLNDTVMEIDELIKLISNLNNTIDRKYMRSLSDAMFNIFMKVILVHNYKYTPQGSHESNNAYLTIAIPSDDYFQKYIIPVLDSVYGFNQTQALRDFTELSSVGNLVVKSKSNIFKALGETIESSIYLMEKTQFHLSSRLKNPFLSIPPSIPDKDVRLVQAVKNLQILESLMNDIFLMLSSKGNTLMTGNSKYIPTEEKQPSNIFLDSF